MSYHLTERSVLLLSVVLLWLFRPWFSCWIGIFRTGSCHPETTWGIIISCFLQSPNAVHICNPQNKSQASKIGLLPALQIWRNADGIFMHWHEFWERPGHFVGETDCLQVNQWQRFKLIQENEDNSVHFTFLFKSPPSSRCLHLLMGRSLMCLHSLHSSFSTIFFVVFAWWRHSKKWLYWL